MKKLREYAEEHNITYRTAYNHMKRGLIDGAYQLETGTVVIPDYSQVEKPDYVIIYARVSSTENKKNLDEQARRLMDFCSAHGWIVKECVKEIGSGVNDSRKKLVKILKECRATRIVVEHKDRLTRFGFNYLKTLCKRLDCEIVVINETTTIQEDIMQDFVSIITSFCAKIYGQRRSKRRTEKLIEELKHG